MIESTNVGELFTNIRIAAEEVQTSKDDVNKFYNQLVDILKTINFQGKYDYGISIMSAGAYAEALKYNLKASVYSGINELPRGKPRGIG